MLSMDDNRLAGAGTSLTRIVAASLVCLLAAACTERRPSLATRPCPQADGPAMVRVSLWQLTAAI